MRKILDLITDEMVKAFEAAGLDAKYAKVTDKIHDKTLAICSSIGLSGLSI